MTESSLTVKIGADVGNLQAKLALAQENLKQTTNEMNSLARQMLNTGNTASGSLVGSFNEASVATVAAKAEVKGLKASLEESIPKVAQMAANTNILAREFTVLGREGLRGNWSRMLGSFTILATGGFGLSYAMLGAAGAVAAVAGALGYLEVKAIEANDAITRIQESAAFNGLSFAREQVRGFERELENLSNISRSDAAKIVDTFARMADASAPLIQALSAEVGDYALKTEETAPKAAQALAKAFSDPLRSGLKFVEGLRGVSAAEIQNVQAAISMGDANKTAAAMIDALDASMRRARPTIDAHTTGLFATFSALYNETVAAESGLQTDSAETQALQRQNAARERQARLIRETTAALVKLPSSTQQTLELAIAAGNQEDPQRVHREHTLANIAKIKAGLAAAQASGNQPLVAQFTADLKAANKELDSLDRKASRVHTAGPHNQMQAWRDELERRKIAERNFLGNDKAQELRFWQSKVGLTKAGSQEQLQVEEQVYNLERDMALSKHRQQEQSIRQAARESKSWSDVIHKQAMAGYKTGTDQYKKQNGPHGGATGLFGNITPESLSNMAFKPIGDGFDQMITGMLRGTQTFQMAWRRMAQDMVLSYIESAIQITIHAVEMETMKTIALALGINTRKGIESSAMIESMALHAESAIQWIVTEAAKAFAGTFGFLASFMGPAAAAPAAASMGAVLAVAGDVASAAGGFDVPNDTFSFLHKREMVLPADISDGLRGMIRGGGAGGGGIHVNAQMNGRMTSAEVMSHGRTIGKAIQRELRNFGAI